MFWGKRDKKEGFSKSQTGRLFSSVRAVRFKETVKPAAPQDRPDKCGALANRVLLSGTTPPSGSGNDELRTLSAILALLLEKQQSVAVDTGVEQDRTGVDVDPG